MDFKAGVKKIWKATKALLIMAGVAVLITCAAWYEWSGHKERYSQARYQAILSQLWGN